MFFPPQKLDNSSGSQFDREKLLKPGQDLFLKAETQNVLEGECSPPINKVESNKTKSILNIELEEVDALLDGQKHTIIQNISVKESINQNEEPIQQKKEMFIDDTNLNIRRPQMRKTRQHTQANFFFVSFMFVFKFIRKLKFASSSFRTTLVTPKIFSLINDLSSDFFVFSEQRDIKRWGKEMQSSGNYYMSETSFNSKIMDSSYGVFHPENQITLIWEVLFALFLLSQIIIQPLRDSFPENFRGYNSPALFFHEKILPLIAFLINSFFIFNTAVFKKGKLMKKRIDIFKKNINKRFLWEGFIVACYSIGAFYDDCFFLEYFILLKFFDFFSLFKKFSERYDYNRKKLIYTQSAFIISQILLFAHISASIFITIAKGSSPAITWLEKLKEASQLENPTASQIYVSSLYWSITTIATLGYGDIVPISQREKLFVICVAFVSWCLLINSINLISEIITENRKNQTKLKNNLRVLNNFMEDRGLNRDLKSQVRRYFDYMEKKNYKEYEIGKEMIKILPPNLQISVMYEFYFQQLCCLPLFYQNFSKDFLQDLSLCMKEFQIGPGQEIIKKNTIQNKLYFITRGEVRKQFESQGNTNSSCIEILKKGNAIGLYEFITQTPIKNLSISEGVTSISYFTYDQFQETVAKHPQDNEMYHKIKDDITINQQGASYNFTCPFCKKSFHIFDQCPLLQYQPNLDGYLKKQQQNIQERNISEIKRNVKKYNSLMQSDSILDNVKTFTLNNKSYTELYEQLFCDYDSSSDNYSLSSQEKIDNRRFTKQQPEKLNIFSQVKMKIQTQARDNFPQLQQPQQPQQEDLSSESDKAKEPKQMLEISSNIDSSNESGIAPVPTQTFNNLNRKTIPKLVKKTFAKQEKTIKVPFMIIDEFDRFFEYEYYFPHNNLSKILRDFKVKKQLLADMQRTKHKRQANHA